MFKDVQGSQLVYIYKDPTLPLQRGWEASAGALSQTSLFLLGAIKE